MRSVCSDIFQPEIDDDDDDGNDDDSVLLFYHSLPFIIQFYWIFIIQYMNYLFYLILFF